MAFETSEALNTCRDQAGDSWDDEEIYFVYEELKPYFGNLKFTKYSDCAGLFVIKKQRNE